MDMENLKKIIEQHLKAMDESDYDFIKKIYTLFMTYMRDKKGH